MRKEGLVLCAGVIMGSSFLLGSVIISRALTHCSNQFYFLSQDFTGGSVGNLGVLRLDQCSGEVKALLGFRLPFDPDSEIGADQSVFVWDGMTVDPDEFLKNTEGTYEESMPMRRQTR